MSVYKSLSGLKVALPVDISRLTGLSRPIKLTALSLSLGVALIGALAVFFRKRRKRTQMIQKKLAAKNEQRQQINGPNHLPHPASQHLKKQHGTNSSAPVTRSASSSFRKLRSNHLTKTQTPNGDVLHSSKKNNLSSSVDGSNCGSGDVGNLLRQRALSASMNSLGGVSNNSSSSTITHSGLDTANMTSADLCQLGMENLSLAISYWEDAVMKLSYLDEQQNSSVLAIPDEDTANLQHRLENLLDLAYRMQENYERLCDRQVESIALESALAVFAERDRERSFDDDSSDQESFVSATDMAHLTDLDFNRDILHHVPLYEAGMLELKYGNVPCRTIRPEMVQCLSDVEFLAKLHGIRLAFYSIFQDESKRDWFKAMGRKLVGDLMIKADKDVDEFHSTYDKMMQFISVDSNWPMIEEELRGRGVLCQQGDVMLSIFYSKSSVSNKVQIPFHMFESQVRVMSFYDIVLDFIMMDAFDDLANPPSTVLTVVQNRWLSNGFKETALATAVWSVLKAKRSLLKFNDGFIAHFYSITEHTSPLLAWGFLGPDTELKEMCNFFKDLVLGFIRDIFSFDKVRYTTVDALAQDILKLAEVQSETAAERLKSGSPDVTPVASYC